MDKMLKLLLNNRGRGVRLQAKVLNDEATLYLYDAIDSWFGIDAQEFVKEVNNIKAETIHLRINSPGGSVFDARAIHTALVQHPAKIISHIDGLAASAASLVALAGDEVEMAEGAFYMIHKAWGLAIGNSDDMLAFAELLDKADGSLVTDYRKKSGKSEDLIVEWMRAETWFTAQEALDTGFVDRIYEGDKAENKFDLSAYNHVPEPLKISAEPERAETHGAEAKAQPGDSDRDNRERLVMLAERGI